MNTRANITTLPIPIQMEDLFVHNNEHPFCDDHSCPCHTDDSPEGRAYRREHIIEPLEAGLLTPNEAADLYAGRQF